ncbi:hypothetical protein JVU11DRAFT_7071 [Chiua virens]|nr:hypothetical protein JVU11DRAFT_7071 [Chiua virens]
MALESPQVRRRPTRVKFGDSQRSSNVVRASVLETALELGFGQNSTVADWIFNNPVSEEPEDLQPELITGEKSETHSESALDVTEDVTPAFTSGSNSMSDASSFHSPANNAPSAAIATIQIHTHKPSLTESPHVHFSDFSSDQLQLFSPFALSPYGIHHGENKDNSVGKPPKDTERSHSQDESFRRDPNHETPELACGDSGYTSEGQYLSKVKVSKGKDKPKGKKGWRPKTPDKSSEKDTEYASDGGYISASSSKSQGKSSGKVKSRAMAFFRRRPKRSASDDDDDVSIPPVPALPTLPRPSSPKPLERRAVPSSPTRSGFSPLSLNLTNPPVSPPRRRVSNSPPPAHARPAPLQRPDHLSAPQRPASSPTTSASIPLLLTPPATVPLPLSVPGTPLSTASFPATVSSMRHVSGTGSISKQLTASSSRQHLSIPPPAPPPTLPLPQPPPSPSLSINGQLPMTPTMQSRRGSPARPIPVAPTTSGSTQPLTPRRTASPFRPILSPRSLPGSESSQFNGKVVIAKRSATALSGGIGSAPAFLQRKIQHGPPPSPRRPPPDAPLPPSPFLSATTRPRTPMSTPSKFHEHLSSVSSVPLSEVLSAPMSKSPSPSTATLSGSSSGPSVRSSHISSISERYDEPAIRDSSNKLKFLRPTTSASSMSESSYSQPISSTFGGPAIDLQSQISDRSDNSSSVYSPPIHRDSSSVTTCDDDDADVDDVAPKSFVDVEDDDASMYPSDDKTAGRRTMYLLDHGELDESGDEIVINGSRYWDNSEVPPPVPPLPPMPTRPGPGYF